jgi:hypothetical protein
MYFQSMNTLAQLGRIYYRDLNSSVAEADEAENANETGYLDELGDDMSGKFSGLKEAQLDSLWKEYSLARS